MRPPAGPFRRHLEPHPNNNEQFLGLKGTTMRPRLLREVLVPRGSVFFLRGDLTVGEARTAMAEAGYSRAPVTSGNYLDDVLGVVHWGSLISGDAARVATVATPAMVLPDTARIANALRQFKMERQQMAIVIDEHGDVDGIVTLEDLLEEIVGEIYDETDPDIPGDIVQLEGWSIEVLEVDHHAVTQVRMRPTPG